MEKNNQVFVDSNYFIALFNPADALWAQARAAAKILETRLCTLVVSNLIFLETVTVLSRRKGRSAAHEAGRYLQTHPFIHSVHIDEILHEEAWRIFRTTPNKNTSFVDCSIIAVMKAEHITHLLTFDDTDFRKLQREYRFSFFA